MSLEKKQIYPPVSEIQDVEKSMSDFDPEALKHSGEKSPVQLKQNFYATVFGIIYILGVVGFQYILWKNKSVRNWCFQHMWSSVTCLLFIIFVLLTGMIFKYPFYLWLRILISLCGIYGMGVPYAKLYLRICHDNPSFKASSKNNCL